MLYPTLLDLCGIRNRSYHDGNSALPLLKNPKAKWDHPAVSPSGRNNHTLRTQRWRYIRYADGTEELYDHQNDPNEWTNLARRESAQAHLAKLRDRLKFSQDAEPVSDLRKPKARL